MRIATKYGLWESDIPEDGISEFLDSVKMESSCDNLMLVREGEFEWINRESGDHPKIKLIGKGRIDELLEENKRLREQNLELGRVARESIQDRNNIRASFNIVSQQLKLEKEKNR